MYGRSGGRPSSRSVSLAEQYLPQAGVPQAAPVLTPQEDSTAKSLTSGLSTAEFPQVREDRNESTTQRKRDDEGGRDQ